MISWYGVRFLGLIISIILTIGLAWGIPVSTGLEIVQNFGYWFLLILSLVTCGVLVGLAKPKIGFSFSFCKWPLLAIVIGSIFLIHSTETRYQIVFDEPSIAAMGLGIHLDRKIYKPSRTHTVEGQYIVLAGDMDKRPPAMSFLISILHDLTGYRFDNNFWVNRLLTPLLLSLIYVIGYGLGGLTGGLWGIFLACSLPLLGFSINSCGLEILFVTLILGLWCTATAYIKKPSPLLLALLICLTIWIPQTRYEGFIFVIPAGIAILMSWLVNRKVHWPIACSFVPVLFLPSLWHHRIFEFQPLLWELKTKASEVPFSFSYFYKNLGHMVHFLFGASGTQPNSLILSALGVFSLILLMIKTLDFIKKYAIKKPEIVTLYIFSATFFIGVAGMLLCYFWGQLDDPIVMRLGLILPIGFIFTIIFCFWKPQDEVLPAGFARRSQYGHWIFAFCALLSFLGWTLPKMNRKEWMEIHILARNTQSIEEFASSISENSLMISATPILWTPLKINCIHVDRALKYQEALQDYIERSDQPTVYLHEWIYHKKDGTTYFLEEPNQSSRIRENLSFEIEPVKTYYPRPYTGIRISKVTRAINPEERNNKDLHKSGFYNLP